MRKTVYTLLIGARNCRLVSGSSSTTLKISPSTPGLSPARTMASAQLSTKVNGKLVRSAEMDEKSKRVDAHAAAQFPLARTEHTRPAEESRKADHALFRHIPERVLPASASQSHKRHMRSWGAFSNGQVSSSKAPRFNPRLE